MNKRIHYCKSLLKTGKPIVVMNLDTGKEINTNQIQGKSNWRIKFQNAIGKEKRRGATTILEVWDDEK